MKNWFLILFIIIISGCEYFLITSKMRNNFYLKKYNKVWEDNNINISIGPLFDTTDIIKIFEDDSLIFKGRCIKSLDSFSADIYLKSKKKKLNFLIVLNDTTKTEIKVQRNMQKDKLKLLIMKTNNKINMKEL